MNTQFTTITPPELKCSIPNHNLYYSHVCTKSHCKHPRLYCPNCLIFLKNECKDHLISLEDLLNKNYIGLQGWITESNIRDLLSLSESPKNLNESSRRLKNSSIKHYVNKKIDSLKEALMKEMNEILNKAKKDLSEYLLEKVELQNEVIKRVKEYYDCTSITNFLYNGLTLTDLHSNIDHFFNNRDLDLEQLITQICKSMKVVDSYEDDHIEYALLTINDLKHHLKIINPIKLQENLNVLKEVNLCLAKVLNKSSLCEGNKPKLAEKTQAYPNYSSNFDFDSYILSIRQNIQMAHQPHLPNHKPEHEMAFSDSIFIKSPLLTNTELAASSTEDGNRAYLQDSKELRKGSVMIEDSIRQETQGKVKDDKLNARISPSNQAKKIPRKQLKLLLGNEKENKQQKAGKKPSIKLVLSERISHFIPRDTRNCLKIMPNNNITNIINTTLTTNTTPTLTANITTATTTRCTTKSAKSARNPNLDSKECNKIIYSQASSRNIQDRSPLRCITIDLVNLSRKNS